MADDRAGHRIADKRMAVRSESELAATQISLTIVNAAELAHNERLPSRLSGTVSLKTTLENSQRSL